MPRRTNTKKPNKTVLLVVEGETEDMYFSDIKAKKRLMGVTIEPIKAKHSDAKTVINEAIENAATPKNSRLHDYVCGIFDGDTIAANDGDFQKGVKALLDRANKAGVVIVRSTPSFEVWFLLHYSMPQKYYPNTSQDKVIDALQKYEPNYVKKGKWQGRIAFHNELWEKQDTAISNAKTLAAKYASDKIDWQITHCDVHNLFALFNECMRAY